MVLSDVVPESAYDEAEIIRRGGTNDGDEDFALIKCLHCGHLYLYDCEVDTVYTNPDDLSQRQVASISDTDMFLCIACAGPVPGHSESIHYRFWAELFGRGRSRCTIFDVTWDEARRSPWAWTIRPSAWPFRRRPRDRQ